MARSVRADHAKLAELAKRGDVTVFSAHDRVEYERLRAVADHTDHADH